MTYFSSNLKKRRKSRCWICSISFPVNSPVALFVRKLQILSVTFEKGSCSNPAWMVNERFCLQWLYHCIIPFMSCSEYVTCSDETGNKSGSGKFLIKWKSTVQAIFIQHNHSGHSYLEAVELPFNYKGLPWLSLHERTLWMTVYC